MGLEVPGNHSRENINITKIQNGFEVRYSNESKKLTADGNNYLYDYTNETYAFDNAQDALKKAGELLSKEE